MTKHFGNIKQIGGTITGTGATVKDVAQTGHGFTVGKVLKFNGTTYALAQADSAANAEVVGIVAVVIDANNFSLLVEGYLQNVTGAGFVPGNTYFLSPISAGNMTFTAPSTTGQISLPLFVADTSTSGYFHRYRPQVLGPGVNTPLPITQGGTGQTTANAAINALLPSQTGNSGKVLGTNGTDPAWQTATSGTVTSVGIATGSTILTAGSPVTTSGNITLSYSGTALPTVNGGTGSTSGQLPFLNAIDNGNFNIWQRGTSFASIGNNAYSADRWVYYKNGTMSHTISRDTDVPTIAQSGVFSNYSLKMTVTGNQPSLGASDFSTLCQNLEGYQWANIAQQPFTISFWVKAFSTGTYYLSLQSLGPPAGDRTYIYPYNINASNTWQQVVIQVPASPTGGTWNYTNSIGLRVNWTQAAGSSVNLGAAGTWNNFTGYYSGTGQINNVLSTSQTFYLAQVSIQPGTLSAPQFQPVNYEQELCRCQRYFYKSYDVDTAPGTATTVGCSQWVATTTSGEWGPQVYYPVRMRTTPTKVFYSTVTGTAGVRRNLTTNADESMSTTITAGPAGHSGAPSHTANNFYNYQFTASADL